MPANEPLEFVVSDTEDGYLGEYQDFSKAVSESRPSLNGVPMYCVMPSPIP